MESREPNQDAADESAPVRHTVPVPPAERTEAASEADLIEQQLPVGTEDEPAPAVPERLPMEGSEADIWEGRLPADVDEDYPIEP